MAQPNQPPPQAQPESSPQQQAQQAQHESRNAITAKVESRRKASPFSHEALQNKQQAIFDELREARGVAAKEPVATGKESEPAKPSEPKPTEPQPLQHTEKDVLSDLEAKLRANLASEASAEQKRAEAERLEKEASAKLARIESAKDDPLQLLSELGITEESWAKHLAQTADTPEMQRIKAVQKQAEERVEALQRQFEEYKQEQQKVREQERVESRRKQAQQLLESSEYKLAAKISNVDTVLQRQQEMQKHLGREVSVAEAAKQLDDSIRDGISKIFADSDIHAMFAPKPQTDHTTAESQSPTTLSSLLSSGTSPGQGLPEPLDWEAKQKLALENLRRAREMS